MFDNREKNVLLSNFLSLGIVQGLNFILPLLVVPYLLYTLGVEIFGLLAMATAFIAYFMILGDYGFNITATREISVHRENAKKLNEIVSSVLMIKILLMLLGFAILVISLFLFDKLGNDALIYLLTFGMVMGQVFFPIWFFQGIEKMGYIAILNIVAKLFFLIAILLFVKEKEDAYLVPLLNSLGFIVVGAISLFYMYKTFKVRFVWQPYAVLREYFLLGWHVFLSRMAVVFYTSSNIFILGLFTSHTVVGYYAIADKIVSALVSLGEILNQVFFPYLSKKWEESRQNYYSIFYKTLKGLVLGMFVVALTVAWWASDIVQLISGKEIVVTTELLQIMSVTVILFPIGGLFSQSFVTQQQPLYVTKSTFWTLLVNVILVGMLVPLYGVYGLACAMILVQLFHFYLNYVYFNSLLAKLMN
ncbi:flippase [bacterium]|nr:flippase [bacterium]MBU1959335.1 flippase [bacterium]